METKSIIIKVVQGVSLAAAGLVGYHIGNKAGKLKAVDEANGFLEQKFEEAREEAEEIAAKKAKQELINTINECFDKKIKSLVMDEAKKLKENKKSGSESVATKEKGSEEKKVVAEEKK